MRRAHRIFLTTCMVGSGIALIAGALLYRERHPVEGWLEKRVIQLYLRKIEPELPFKIESVDVGKESLRDILNWKVPELTLVLRRDDWRARLSGPLELKRARLPEETAKQETDVNVTYRPKIVVERISKSQGFGPFDTYISARVHVRGAGRRIEDLADIREAKVKVSSDGKVAWAPLGVEIASPYLRVDWVAPGAEVPTTNPNYPEAKEGTVGVQARAKSVSWSQAGAANRAADLAEPSLNAEIPLELLPQAKLPMRIGPDATFDFQAKSGEVLWDDAYVNVPWSSIPVHGTAHVEGFKPVGAEFVVGPEKSALELSARLGPPLSASWKNRGSWQIAALAKAVLDATAGSTGPLASLNALKKVKIRKGALVTQGSVTLTTAPSAEVELKVDGLDLDFPGPAAAVRGLKFRLQAQAREGRLAGASGELEAPGLYLKKLQGKLARMPFSVTPEPRRALVYRAKIGDTQNLPLEISGVPFHLGSLTGTLDLSRTKDEDLLYDLVTHIEIPPLGIERVIRPLCLPIKRIPPALLSVRFPTLELSNGAIEPTGEARIDIFDGEITLGEIGLYDYFTDVPETDLTMDIRGIRLDEFGSWSALGTIDGVLEGYAHDVTIQSWLPTHFDFRIEAKPRESSKIVFSPEAMEDFIKLIDADAFEQIPGVVRWFMFGWPSNINSGYDVNYAGISMFSQDGNILLETLDPKEEVQKGNHFILNGTRFKMPLKSSRYPLIVDNSAMSTFMRQKIAYLIDLAEQKRLEREEAKKKTKGTTKDENPEPVSEIDCVPDVLRPAVR